MGKLLVIKGADFSNVAVSTESLLDSTAYENYTYRQLFEQNNLLGISAGFENGSYAPLTVNAGSPSITSESSDTGTYSLKVFGSSSQQLILAGSTPTRAFMACRVKCNRYTAGGIGVIFGSNGAVVRRTTSGYETASIILDRASAENRFYVGSFSSANLDGYVDTPVAINMGIFSTAPSVETLTALYNTYVTYKRV